MVKIELTTGIFHDVNIDFDKLNDLLRDMGMSNIDIFNIDDCVMQSSDKI